MALRAGRIQILGAGLKEGGIVGKGQAGVSLGGRVIRTRKRKPSCKICGRPMNKLVHDNCKVFVVVVTQKPKE